MNQRGSLTPQQMERLASAMHISGRGCGLVIIPGLLFGCVGAALLQAMIQGHHLFVIQDIPLGIILLILLAFIVSGFLLFSQQNRTKKRFEQEMQMGNMPLIEQVQGAVVWDQEQKGYAIQVPGYPPARLLAFVGNSGLFSANLTRYLSPGPYRFSLVRGKNASFILSAQPIQTQGGL